MILKFIRNVFTDRRKNTWNRQYSQGTWEYLNDHLEESRFNAVRALVKKYAPYGKIFEVGCGEGILQSRMDKGSYSKYLGIDISEVAIGKAAYLRDKLTEYQCADMEKFAPTGKFDIIIFNESLYYAKNPAQLMHRYAEFLNSKGFLIISIYETDENKRVINSIRQEFMLLDEKISINERGRWYCQVYPKHKVV